MTPTAAAGPPGRTPATRHEKSLSHSSAIPIPTHSAVSTDRGLVWGGLLVGGADRRSILATNASHCVSTLPEDACHNASLFRCNKRLQLPLARWTSDQIAPNTNTALGSKRRSGQYPGQRGGCVLTTAGCGKGCESSCASLFGKFS
jgi:hypothetical protein